MTNPGNTVRVWYSDWCEPYVGIAVWGMKPEGFYGMTFAAEIHTAREWNTILEKLEDYLD